MRKEDSVFFKVYGVESENNTLIKLNKQHYVLFYGFFADGIGNYRLRKDYYRKPTIIDIRTDIENVIDERTSQKILSGFEFEGVNIWLSQENQINFRSVVSFPVKFKVGENEGVSVYKTFSHQEELSVFNNAIADYIHSCLNEGWDAKDNLDCEKFKEVLR